MNRLLFCVFIAFLFGINILCGQKLAINSNWKFHQGDITENSSSIKWETVNVPHTWNALDVLDDAPGIRTGVCWYKKQLYIPESMQKKQVYIYFEGANQDAVVFVNNNEVGSHYGGYTAFCFNITDFLNRGGKNTLTVQLDNSLNPDVPPVGGDMERFGGIYRDVYLIAKNDVHFDIGFFASSGVFITTPEVTKQNAVIQLRTHVVNEEEDKLKLKFTVFDEAGKPVLSSSIFAESSITHYRMSIANPQLWTPDNPYRYTLVSQIYNEKGEVMDEVSQPFGIRTLAADKDKGILINGSPIFIKGIGKHQDYDQLGYAVANEVLRNDVVLLKKMGANLLRSHYPLDPVTYDACDELGVMVWGKIPIMDKVNHTPEFMANAKTMMREVMYQNFNRPSFILWGFACEIFGDMDWYWPKPRDPEKVEENLKKTEAFSKEMEAFIREIDPYRLTANDYHTDPTPEYYLQANQTNLQMVNAWNLYQGWYHNSLDTIGWALETFRAYNPDVAFLIAEFGAGSDPRLHAYEPTIFDFTTEYQDKFHQAYLAEVNKYDFVHGMCIWTLVDFQVSGRADAVPHINSKGLLRADRTPKDSYYLYQAHWSEKPMVHIAARDWTRRKEIVAGEAAVREIRVYSNQPQVELFLNGISLGVKDTNSGNNQDKISKWEVPLIHGKNHLYATTTGSGPFLSDALEIDFEFIPKNLPENGFPETGLCINVGQSRSWFIDDYTGNIWMPDQEFEEGNYGHVNGTYKREWPNMQAWQGIREGVGQNIKGTRIDPVYQTFLEGITDYRIEVPNGKYQVTLLFSEPFEKDAGERVFDVKVNDIMVFEALDMSHQFGTSTAIERTVSVNVSGGEIRLSLEPIQGIAVLNGLKIVKER